MSTKIVLIGAGSAQFGFGTIGETLQSPVLKDSIICLRDINGEALEKVAATARAFVNRAEAAVRDPVDARQKKGSPGCRLRHHLDRGRRSLRTRGPGENRAPAVQDQPNLRGERGTRRCLPFPEGHPADTGDLRGRGEDLSEDLVAGGLNHFSVVLQATYRDSGRDAYPEILQKAPAFFEKEPGYSDVWASPAAKARKV